MGSKQKSQQKLPRQNTKTIRDAAHGRMRGPKAGNRPFKSHG